MNITKIVSVSKSPILNSRNLAAKQIALTFDDGPDELHTPEILDVLKREGWPGHFLCQGRWAEKNPEIPRRATQEGHIVGSHSWSHPHLTEISLEEAKSEIEKGVAAVAQAAGVDQAFFRFPFGAKNDVLEQYVRARGLISFWWSIDSRDWEIDDQSALIDHILKQVRDNDKGIILLHDIRAITATILPTLIKELKRLEFLPVKFTAEINSALAEQTQTKANSLPGRRNRVGSTVTSDALASSTEHFRCALDLVQVPASEEKEFVYSPLTRGMALLPASRVRILRRCRSFRTLDEHSQLLCKELQFGPLHVQSLRQNLNELAGIGLLISSEALTGQFKDSAQAAPPPISAVAIPTRDRPEKLRIGVESYARCSREYEQEVKFFIADQSEEIKTQKANLELLAELKAEFGCQVYYGGAQEKEQLARTLAEHTGHRFDLVNFAVGNDERCPKAYGANRNALLLSTIGSLTLQTDDDGQCRTKASPQWRAGLTLSSNYSELQSHFPSKDEVENLESGFLSTNVFALHQQLLGKSLATCIKQHRSVNLDNASASFFSRPAPHVVSVTMLGTAGGSGIGTAFYFLTQIEKARKSLLRSEADYRYSMSNQELIRFASNPIISDGSFCGGLNLGMDNRLLLPPFMPVQRNEDGVFGRLMSLGSSGYFGFLPALTFHPSGTSTPSPREDLRDFATTVTTGYIMEALLKELNPSPRYTDSASNLVTIGKLVMEFAASPLPDFEERLRLLLMRRASRLIGDLESDLKHYKGEPAFWAADVEMCVLAMQKAMATKEYIVASDLRAHFGEEAARQLMQRLILRFGELLTIWPDLRTAAAELQNRGWQPFRQI